MILGAILAGGAARRFGSDKALASIAGKPMIEHVRSALAPWVDDVVVTGRADCEGLFLPDWPDAGLGPLGGLAAALEFARTEGFDRVLTVPCDTPMIDHNLLGAVAAAPGSAFVVDCPVIGIWPIGLVDRLKERLLLWEDRSMHAWARSIGAVGLDLAAPVNVNQPSDLDRLSA